MRGFNADMGQKDFFEIGFKIILKIVDDSMLFRGGKDGAARR
jgi:hypothetical protein